ncbi:MAG: hypothetical protein M3O62_07150 [Pseudomonadota bacterium]|nr:hypothetical protein [Pseudomonadota bacterium]
MNSSQDAVHRVYARDVPEGEVCAYVFARLAQLGADLHEISPGAVANAMSWTGEQHRRAIITALDFLSYCEAPVLVRRFELWADPSSEEVLDQPIHVFTDSEMRHAYEEGQLYVPAYGEAISDFSRRISVAYYVSDFGRRIATGDGT